MPSTKSMIRSGIIGGLLLTISIAAAAATPAEEWQTDVRIASGGTNFAALWRQGEPSRLMLSRVSREGVIVDEPPVALAEKPMDFDIVAGGSSYLILWTDSVTGALYARRMSVEGTFLDTQPILLTQLYVYTVSAVWDGSRFFVVFGASDYGARGVYGTFLDQNGVASAPTQLTAPERFFEIGQLQVLRNRELFLVTRSVYVMCDPCGARYQSRWTRVSPTGEPVDLKAPLLLASTSARPARLASDGVSFVGISDGNSIFTMQADADTLQTGALRRLFTWFGPTVSDLTWSGESYLVVSYYESALYPPAMRHWLSMTHLSRNGMTESRLVMELTAAPRGTPRIAVNANGDAIIALVEVSPGGVSRVRFHTTAEMHPSPLPPEPPAVIAAVKSGNKTRVLWTIAAPDIDGFVFSDAPFRFNPNDRPVLAIDSVARSADVPTWEAPLLIRSFNSGGMSEAVAIVPVSPGRQRVARH